MRHVHVVNHQRFHIYGHSIQFPDRILRFRRAYTKRLQEHRQVSTNRLVGFILILKLFRNYVTGRFFLDIVSWTSLLYSTQEITQFDLENNYLYISIFFLLRILRLLEFLKYLTNTTEVSPYGNKSEILPRIPFRCSTCRS